jgi:UDP-2,4-diacetamido-2,4,6-trideoxy-beta-L-altropyranose hydrolase
MRCITLADALKNIGANCYFICRYIPRFLGELIEKKGHTLFLLAKGSSFEKRGDDVPHAPWLGTIWEVDAAHTVQIIEELRPDWIVLDHYALDIRWEKIVLKTESRLLVLDDLFDRPHYADILLDQNLGRTKQYYHKWVPDHCKILVGPKYALLRPEFARARQQSLAHRQKPQLKNILITMGGADKDNVSGWLLDCLSRLSNFASFKVTVVLGASAPNVEAVKVRAAALNVKVLQNVSNMAELMSDADLCIGAAGSTSWERACLGVPAVIFSLADNQTQLCEALDRMEVAKFSSIWKAGEFLDTMHILSNADYLSHLSWNAANLVDGLGSLRVVELLQTISANTKR